MKYSIEVFNNFLNYITTMVQNHGLLYALFQRDSTWVLMLMVLFILIFISFIFDDVNLKEDSIMYYIMFIPIKFIQLLYISGMRIYYLV